MKRIFSCLFLFGIIFQIHSQDTTYARYVVKRLSSPEFKGRGYVENGDVMAANFIIGEFQKYGLKPFKKDYSQFFTTSVNTFPGKVIVKINNSILIPGVDYIIDGTSVSVKGKFSVTDITRKEIVDIASLKERITTFSPQKILIIDNRKIQAGSKDEIKRTDDLIELLKYDFTVPTAGTIILTKEKLNFDASKEQYTKPTILISKDIDLDSVSTVDITLDNNFINKYKIQNIIGYIPGSVKSDSFIVVAAHYDHLGLMGKETYFPGANDNASGVAMLLNLAKHYKEKPPKYNVVFIALAGEELGLLGSNYFVENSLISLKKIKFMINFDIAGTGDEGITIVNGSVFKKQFDAITKINDDNKLLPAVKVRGEACISDHCPFYNKKVPCFYIYTLGGIKAYHDIYDKAETLPLTKFKEYVTLMVKFVDTL